MLKYFILVFALFSVLVMGIFGVRGQKFSQPPLQLFPDMDVQDKVLSQEPSSFFADGMGSRRPVGGTLPHSTDDGVFPVEFGAGMDGHYYTGAIDDYFATGLPKELGLDEITIGGFLRRGEERFTISCAPCHGSSGNGKGITSYYGISAIANLHDPRFGPDQYPEGRMYHVITSGQGLMGGYGATLPVRDRWAIVAYVRALQAAKVAGDAAGKPAEDTPQAEDAAPKAGEDAPKAGEDAPKAGEDAPKAGDTPPNAADDPAKGPGDSQPPAEN